MTQFLKDRASDSEEVVTPLMPDGTYLSRNSATLGPINFHASYRWCWDLTHESSLFISVSISIIFHSIPVHNFASRDLQLIPVLFRVLGLEISCSIDTILLLEPSVKKCIIFQQDAESTVNQS
eukprot:UN2413